MAEITQFDLFHNEIDTPHDPPIRNDVRVGDAGEDLTSAKLKKWGYDVHKSSPGNPVDLLVEVDGRLLCLQIKTKTGVSDSMSYTFDRGYYYSNKGKFGYGANDFHIAACVNLADEKVLFLAGVPSKSISWKRHIFLQENGEYQSWLTAVNENQKKEEG